MFPVQGVNDVPGSYRGYHSPLEGESQRPSRQAKADAVGGQPIPASLPPVVPLIVTHGAPRTPPPARLRASPLSCRLPLEGGVIHVVMVEGGFDGVSVPLGWMKCRGFNVEVSFSSRASR